MKNKSLINVSPGEVRFFSNPSGHHAQAEGYHFVNVYMRRDDRVEQVKLGLTHKDFCGARVIAWREEKEGTFVAGEVGKPLPNGRLGRIGRGLAIAFNAMFGGAA